MGDTQFIHKETNGNTWTLWKLYQQLVKKRHLSKEQVANVVEIAIHKLPYMENLYRQAEEETEKMQGTILRLANDIVARKHKISTLDKTAFSIELECKRTEQRVQQLIDKKDRLEKLIENIVNGEGYSKLKHTIKENVKAALSEEKKVISVCFAALILTLKTDPKMVNLIYSMPTDNDGKQHEDINNNITQYIESNKDRILDFTEKNYENLVEALANNAVDTTADTSFSSNPTSSLPSSSSSTFSPPSDQSDTYRIEDPESFRQNKDDSND
jgi:hypothetical protein